MAAYRRAVLLRRLSQPYAHLHPAASALSSSPSPASPHLSPPSPLLNSSRPFSSSSSAECSRRLRIEPPLSTLRSGSTSDGAFGFGGGRRWGSAVGALLVGQAAFFFGVCNQTALAQDDSVGRGASTNEHAEENTTGLQLAEDGSVVSNEHTIKWRICTDKARDLFVQRKIDEAEKFFQLALREAKEGFGLRDPHVASALNNLAEFYRLRKEYEKAELLYLEAIEILEESFGSDDIRVGTALHSLGTCYHLQCKFAQAQLSYERALKIEGRVMGVGHPEYASTMYLLGKVLSLQGKGKDAETLIQESIRILEEAGLGESPTCIQRMRYLSLELIKTNQLAEAEIWQRKILHNMELSKGWDSLDTTNAAELLTLTLQAMGKLNESEELLERCLEVRKKILSEDHFQVSGTLVHLARLTMLKFISDQKVNNDLARSDLVRAKLLLDDSIRIAEGILDGSREDLNKPNSTLTTDRVKVAAIGVFLQALEVAGLLECGMKRMLALEEKDFQLIELALDKCISLYKEPQTQSIVLNTIKQEYLRCLRRLIGIARGIVESNLATPQTTGLQELLGEAQQIMKEMGEEGNKNV